MDGGSGWLELPTCYLNNDFQTVFDWYNMSRALNELDIWHYLH